MNTDLVIENLLQATNFYSLDESNCDEFVKGYIQKLIQDVVVYVDSNITVGNIEFRDVYNVEHEISQEITGLPAAYSAVDGEIRALTAFAESYSKLGIAEYDEVCKEVLLDFLNLHNGLFIVYLSENNICELSLSVPKQNGKKSIQSPIEGKVTVVPINFSYGTVNFLLVELLKNTK